METVGHSGIPQCHPNGLPTGSLVAQLGIGRGRLRFVSLRLGDTSDAPPDTEDDRGNQRGTTPRVRLCPVEGKISGFLEGIFEADSLARLRSPAHDPTLVQQPNPELADRSGPAPPHHGRDRQRYLTGWGVTRRTLCALPYRKRPWGARRRRTPPTRGHGRRASRADAKGGRPDLARHGLPPSFSLSRRGRTSARRLTSAGTEARALDKGSCPYVAGWRGAPRGHPTRGDARRSATAGTSR
jgi:hypothetical protein